jgi:hypothetical protein
MLILRSGSEVEGYDLDVSSPLITPYNEDEETDVGQELETASGSVIENTLE